jgi:hypothetical protein
MSVWAEPKLAYIYVLAEALADKMVDGSTERGLVHEAMRKIELADKYVEKRLRESVMSGVAGEAETPNG